MKRVHLFSHAVCKHYSAPRLSIEYIISVSLTILTFTIPFYMCISPRYALTNNYNSHDKVSYLSKSTIATPVGVWLKHDTYREQPKVNFQSKLIFVAQIKETTSQQTNDDDGGGRTDTLISKELYYSTIDDFNEVQSETFRSASTISREEDDDFDGVMDRLLLEVKMPLYANEYVYGIQCVAILNYRLENHVRMEMESLVYLHHESGLAGSKFTSTGDLNLRQIRPIPIIHTKHDDIWKLYADEPLLELDNVVGTNVSQSNILTILEKYKARSIATDFNQRFPIWSSENKDLYTENEMEEVYEFSKNFQLKLTIDIPKIQSIVYVPTLMEVLAEAWIRYLSFLVIIGFLVQRILFFLFTNHFMKTNVVLK